MIIPHLVSKQITQWFLQGVVKGTVSNVVEDVVRNSIMVTSSGYALVFGFPSYIVASLVNSTIGYVDPLRIARFDEVGNISAGWVHSAWSTGYDHTADYVEITMVLNALVNDTSSGYTIYVPAVSVMEIDTTYAFVELIEIAQP